MTRLDQTKSLAERIRQAGTSSDKVEGVLQTDQRVLARITDGIYRQPASALRELIANSYDADATQVVIETDAPRFDRMIIRDNGSGMGVETLAHVLEHIGGSLKRTVEGAKLEVTSSSNSSLSPGGRKLIGKIGIGLFSVAQITPHFQVITKTKGEKTRRVADIILAPEDAERALAERGEDAELKTGTFRIWSVPATDEMSHGTEIVLMDLRPQTKELLSSHPRWAALRPDPDSAQENWMPTATVVPAFHIGGLDFSTRQTIQLPASLPWDVSDSPGDKFRKLVDGVRAQTAINPNPELEQVLDNYLRLIWTLSLALPSRYVDGHPFDLKKTSDLQFFAISNDPKAQASELLPQSEERVRDLLELTAPNEFEDTNFEVLVDGVQLSRPLKFWRAANSKHSMSNDLLFVGKCEPDLSRVPEEFRGGNLRFEAYLYWSPKIVPKDHNGVLVRLKGASGTLFDSTFMGYQVSEQTRLKQLTAEIFVHEGLEGALNIDRESFNYASIHYQYISRWLHGAIRQFANRHKTISGKLLGEKKLRMGQQLGETLQRTAEGAWLEVRGRDADTPPEISIEDDSRKVSELRSAGATAFNRSALLGLSREEKGKKLPLDLEPRLKAIALVLQAYGVFDNMPYATQEKLISDIGKIISAEASDAS